MTEPDRQPTGRNASHPRVLLTRSASGNAAWAAELRRLGAEPVCLPCLEQVDLDAPGRAEQFELALGRARWLAVASPRAAEASHRLLGQRGLAPSPSQPLSTAVAAVGPATADACRSWLGRCDAVAEPPTGRGLGQTLRRIVLDADANRPGDPPAPSSEKAAAVETKAGGRRPSIVVAAARHGRRDVEEAFRHTGVEVLHLVVYAMRPIARRETDCDARDPDIGAVDAIFFASPSAVRGYSNQVGDFAADDDAPRSAPRRGRALRLAIGPTTAAALEEHGTTVDGVAEHPSLDGLWQAFQALAQARGATPASAPGPASSIAPPSD